MKNLQGFSDWLKINEKNNVDHKHEYGCIMLSLPIKEWQTISLMIAEDDLYEDEKEPGKYGLESEPHCTVLYGLHDSISDDEIIERLNNFLPCEIKLENMSLFENEKYDVLKFDVEAGEDLYKMNSSLRELPHTNNYPDYHPHATIAYLKAGSGKKYAQKLSEPIVIKPDKILYSKVTGEKLEYPFKKQI